MNTSLTTFDGYPRDDIDVAQSLLPKFMLAKSPVYQSVVRTTRARIIRLRNDYKRLMSRIEDGLHNHHAQARSLSTSQPASAPHAPTTSASSLEAPFAKVNSVVAGSPAEDAGLKAGDKIRRFGDVDWINHEKLSKVAETVQRNEGVSHQVIVIHDSCTDACVQRSITVRIQRSLLPSNITEELQLQLTPRRDWGGRGLLGCHLLPL